MYFLYVVREKRHTELFTRASSWMTVVDNGGISTMQWSEHSPSTAVHYVLFLLLSSLLLRFFKGLSSFPFSVVTNIRNFDLAHFNTYWQNFRVMKQIVITLIDRLTVRLLWVFDDTFPPLFQNQDFPLYTSSLKKEFFLGQHLSYAHWWKEPTLPSPRPSLQ